MHDLILTALQVHAELVTIELVVLANQAAVDDALHVVTNDVRRQVSSW